MEIGKIILEKTAALAPMAGVADRAFREICHEFGAAYTVSEMTSSKGMHFSDKKTRALLEIGDNERPAAAQIFGDEPILMAEAAKKATEFSPDAIDLNMGCPAPKIAGNGGGSALMKNPRLAGEICEAVAKSVSIPVTVKFRKGWDSNNINAVEFAHIMESSGATALTIHGRTREQFYAPPVDLDIIAAVKSAVSIPVIGNGGCESVSDVIHMYEYTGCDLVMIGQGALGAPWIFAQVKAYLERGETLAPPTLEDRMNIMLRHISLACTYKPEGQAMRESRKHAAWYIKGVRGAPAFRKQSGTLLTLDDAKQLVDAILKANEVGKELYNE